MGWFQDLLFWIAWHWDSIILSIVFILGLLCYILKLSYDSEKRQREILEHELDEEARKERQREYQRRYRERKHQERQDQAAIKNQER